MLQALKKWLGQSPEVTLSQRAPTLETPMWQMCTVAQFDEQAYRAMAQFLHLSPARHRKSWEFAYITRVIQQYAGSLSGKRGLGFGVGREPLVAYFAARGAKIVATDLDAAAAETVGWISTGQHSASLQALDHPGICPTERLLAQAEFRSVDMNNIPDDLTGFDFLWSSCSLEHLGSLEAGLAFVQRAMRCLRPGGIAVHTTEFNVNSDHETVESPGLSIYRRRDVLELAKRLQQAGHAIPALNFEGGDTPRDAYVDLPPYQSDLHVKIKVLDCVTTSFGLFARQKAGRKADPAILALGPSARGPYSVHYRLIHNSSACEQIDDDTLRVATPAALWGYGVELPLLESLHGREVKVQLCATVQGNPACFGILRADGSDFVHQVVVPPASNERIVELCAPPGAPTGSLMVRSGGNGNSIVEFHLRHMQFIDSEVGPTVRESSYEDEQ